jgi:hypothetical protein
MRTAVASELYRRKAIEMRGNAARAQSSYLRAMYRLIADEWDCEAELLEHGPLADGQQDNRAAHAASLSPQRTSNYRGAGGKAAARITNVEAPRLDLC